MRVVLWCLGVQPLTHPSFVKDSSVIAVQIFDQRKFKKRDQGFLGVVNIRVADVIDLELGGHGECIPSCLRLSRLAFDGPPA